MANYNQDGGNDIIPGAFSSSLFDEAQEVIDNIIVIVMINIISTKYVNKYIKTDPFKAIYTEQVSLEHSHIAIKFKKKSALIFFLNHFLRIFNSKN